MIASDDRVAGASGPGTVLALAGLIVYAATPLLPSGVTVASGAILVVNAFALVPRNDRLAIAASASLGCLILYSAVPEPLFIWPVHLLLPTILASLIVGVRGHGASFFCVAKRGRLECREWLYVAVIAILAAVALIGWVWLFDPDLSPLRPMLPACHRPVSSRLVSYSPL